MPLGFSLGKKKDKDAGPAEPLRTTRSSVPDTEQPRPQQPELDRLINEMLDSQGLPPQVRRPCPASARRDRAASCRRRVHAAQ